MFFMKKIVCSDTGEVVYKYSDYLKTKHWLIKKIRISKKYNYTCQMCGCSCKENKPNIHHNTYKRIGNEWDTDLNYLCETCHHAIHKTFKEFDINSVSGAVKRKKRKKNKQPVIKNKPITKRDNGKHWCRVCKHLIYICNDSSKKDGYYCKVTNKPINYNKKYKCKTFISSSSSLTAQVL